VSYGLLVVKAMHTYWEESIKQYFNKSRRKYLGKLKKEIIKADTISKNLLDVVTEVRSNNRKIGG
jgi:hypothetical protein